MNSFGNTIRTLREGKALPLLSVASFLGIDPCLLGKMECDEQQPTREQVIKLAKYFNVHENDLLVTRLNDQFVVEVVEVDSDMKALQMAEENVAYIPKTTTNKSSMISAISTVFNEDGRVACAWLFGSFARGDEGSHSDVDIMVDLNNEKQYSMFDLLDITFLLENELGRKVDLVEKGFLSDFALQTATKDLIKIYG